MSSSSTCGSWGSKTRRTCRRCSARRRRRGVAEGEGGAALPAESGRAEHGDQELRRQSSGILRDEGARLQDRSVLAERDPESGGVGGERARGDYAGNGAH